LAGLAAPVRADILERGQLAITGFSGTAPGSADAGSAAIDTGGAVLRILDVTNPAGPLEARRLTPRTRFKTSAGEIGQVFGIALDDGRTPDGRFGAPNIYLAATSAFGLRIAGGTPEGSALSRGQPGAVWMAGQFGTAKSGGPGTIWRVDGRTGEVSLLANIRTYGADTGAPSLGALAFDADSRMLYVSNLQTGLVHRIDLNGVDFGYFDHGVEGRTLAQLAAVPPDSAQARAITDPVFEPGNPESWGFAARERLVYGLAVYEKRLYYAVAEGPQIWSVGLNADGSFAGDARAEILQTGTAAESVIADITFDQAGVLHIAERVFPGLEAAASADGRNPSAVRRFALTPSTSGPAGQYWAPLPDIVAADAALGPKAVSGGVALAYAYDASGALNTSVCEGTLWSTAGPTRLPAGTEAASPQAENAAYALRGHPLAPSATAEAPVPSIIADDAHAANPRGIHALGAVKAYAPCADTVAGFGASPTGLPQAEAASRGPLLFVEHSCKPCPVGASCTCRVSIVNRGREAPKQSIGFRSAATILSGPRAGELRGVRQSTPDGAQWTCDWLTSSRYDCRIEGSFLRPGTRRYVDLLIDTRDLVETGNFGLQSCATLLLQNGEVDGQRACTETGLDMSVVESGQDQCVAGAPCSSQTTVVNLSPVPFEGEVKLTHSVTVPGQGNLAGSLTITPQLDCKPEAAAASPFECKARMSLAPGESRIYEMSPTLAGDGGTLPLSAVICATVTDGFLDISKLLPGLPPVPWSGPGYHCRPLTVLPEGSAVPGGTPSSGGGSAQTSPDAAGGGQGSGGAQPGQGGSGTGPAGATPAADGVNCPQGTIQQGTQCFCPRGARWAENGCVLDTAAANGTVACADGALWNGVACIAAGGSTSQGGPSSTAPQNISCKPPLQAGANGCACPKDTKWSGLTCTPAADYESPVDYGGLGAGPGAETKTNPSGSGAGQANDRVDYGGMGAPLQPCPDGQVRDAKGVCGCPPYLEAVVEAGKQLCCLVPCPPGMKRENAQCVPQVIATPVVLKCPEGWSGVHPACCQPGMSYANGRCERPAATPVLQCPAGWNGVHPNCCAPGTTFVNGRCERPIVALCEGGMTGTPPNCACAANTQWDGGRCAPILCPPGTNGVHPVCCPQGATYVNGRCERPSAPPPPPPPPPPVVTKCQGNMLGTPPNCYCPPNTQFDGRRCVRNPPPQCQGGMIGTPPNCECPPGAQFDGRRCARIAPARCEGDMLGTPPNCYCPPNTQFDGRRCARIAPPRCQGDMLGTPPNCYCPPNTQFDGRRCARIAPPRCQGDMLGTPPNCYCPRNTQFDGRRCAPVRRDCQPGWSGVFPNCCPPGTNFVGGRCQQPAPEPCRNGMVGTPPNCSCPPGTRFSRYRRGCTPIRDVQPQPQPTGPNCPPGFRVLTTPNRYGAYCEIIPQPGPTAPPPPPPQQNCRMEQVCAQWVPQPNAFSKCGRYENRRVCGSGPVVR